jgi:hypothetical protein
MLPYTWSTYQDADMSDKLVVMMIKKIRSNGHNKTVLSNQIGLPSFYQAKSP